MLVESIDKLKDDVLNHLFELSPRTAISLGCTNTMVDSRKYLEPDLILGARKPGISSRRS